MHTAHLLTYLWGPYCNSIVIFSTNWMFYVAVLTVYSVLMNIKGLFTLIHFHLFQNMYYVSTDSMHYSWIQGW